MAKKEAKLEVGDIIVCNFGYRLIVQDEENVFLAIDLKDFTVGYDSETLEEMEEFYSYEDEDYRIIKNTNIKIVEENLINGTLKERK